jgi:hypothetical protein
MGRPKGSTNKSDHHKAGGFREGAGRNAKTTPKPIMKNPWEATAAVQGPSDNHSHLNQTSSKNFIADRDDDKVFGKDRSTNNTAAPIPPINVGATTIPPLETPELLHAFDLEAEEEALFEDDSSDDEYDPYVDDDEDDDDDYGDDDNEIDSINGKNVYQYMPPRNTPLDTYLHTIKDSILKKEHYYDRYLSNACHWLPPMMDPLSSNSLDPAKWYISSEVWVFCWIPTLQYHQYLSRSSCKCIYCKKEKVVISKGEYRYRPFFYFDRIVWVLHGRLMCNACKKSFTEIDPLFLKDLPTNILERFPFISSRKGPGIHCEMMIQFISQCTDGNLFGRYTKSINEMQRYRYDISRVGFLDEVYNKFTNGLDRAFGIQPLFYPVFKSPGHFNGIVLTAGMMKRFFLQFMRSREEYLQNSFQYCSDEGASADHSHKFSKKLTCGKRGIFDATYSIMSLSGQVSSLRLTFGKSNDEIEPVLEDLKKTRLNVGVPLLKRFETDNVKGDGGLWCKVFPELKQGLSIVPKPSTFTEKKILIKDDSINYMDTLSAANTWARLIVGEMRTKEFIGLDTEWSLADGSNAPARILQIQLGEKSTAVFNLSVMGVSENKAEFPSELKKFLELPEIIAWGVNIGIDCSKLEKFGVIIKQRIDLRLLAKKQSLEQTEGTSLQALAKKYLGVVVDKSLQCEDWNQNPLPQDMIEYAAFDCMLSKRLVNTIMNLMQSSSKAMEPIKLNSRVDYIFRGKPIAKGTVTFIGVSGHQFRWGRITIGEKKAMIELTHVFAPGVALPINHPDESISTFGQVMKLENKIIGVRTSSLRLSNTVLGSPVDVANKVELNSIEIMELDSAVANPGDTFYDCDNFSNQVDVNNLEADDDLKPAAALISATSNLKSSIDKEDLQTARNYQSILSSKLNDIINLGCDDEDDEDQEALFSRNKEDIFHAFKKLPLTKTCPVRRSIIHLLIMATFSMVKEDYDSYTSYLKIKYDLEDDDMISHFFNNKEEWRQYVRMIVHSPKTHASNIKRVHTFMQVNEETKPFYNQDVKEYFDSFETKCIKGLFQEIQDVQMFQWAGTGKGGLDRWYRRRGTVRNENLHQKLYSCIGLHSVGAEVGHYLLLLIAYKYNISTGIHRMGHLNHGHFFHDLIDRIQKRVLHIYDVEIYIKHQNTMLINNPIKDYTAVGIGSLSYDSRFVTFGDPHPNLKGDLKFVARKMGLKLPPLEISSRDERIIFNDFRRNHIDMKKLSPPLLNELAMIYKSKADGVSIFPKLPSQVAMYDSNFMKIATVNMTVRRMTVSYSNLLKGLSSFTSESRFGFLCDHTKNDENMVNVDEAHLIMQNTEESKALSTFELPLFVPPIVAPLQTKYIIANEIVKSRAEKMCLLSLILRQDGQRMWGT